MIGRTLSHYRIESELGRGGMGVVYRAVDTKLGRPVALKFLTSALAQEPEAVLRFEREARAASSLNDPGICTVYEVDRVEGDVFIAMELLEGETLFERLKRGPLPFAEAIRSGLQLIGALHAAHGKSVLHRDIKPGNVFVLPDGRVKLLDFGLAKVDEQLDPYGETALVLSRVGTVAGTEAYMSPEQALGKVVDARSDLFSFALVLTEMVTGHRVFEGTQAAIFDAILNRPTPPPSKRQSGVPPLFDTIVTKALEKDPAARYQTAAEFRADLIRLEQASASSSRSEVVRAFSGWRTWVTAAVAFVALAVGALYWTQDDPAPTPGQDLTGATFSRLTEHPGLEASPSLAPDAASFVFSSRMAGNWDIYWQRVGETTAVNLTADSAADEFDPSISPDGRQVAFRSEREGGGIFVADVSGKNVKRLSNFCHNPTWSPDQQSIVCAVERVDLSSARRALSPIWVLDTTTGTPRQLTTTDGVQPTWSPDGQRIAFWTYGPARIFTVPAGGGTPHVLVGGEPGGGLSNPVWSPDGRALFYSSGGVGGSATTIRHIAIDATGQAVPGTDQPLVTPSTNAGFVSFSRDGRHMSYLNQSFTRNFSRMRLDRPAEPPTSVTQGPHVYRQQALSPDGTRLTFASQNNIFVMHVDGSGLRQLTTKSVSRGPQWSPDGSRIAFYSRLGAAVAQIWTMDPDGANLRQETSVSGTRGLYYPVWSPDGRTITATTVEGQTLIVDLSTPLVQRRVEVLPPLPTPGVSFVAWQWSADGSQLSGWKLLPDGQSGGVTIYDRSTRSYRDVSKEPGIYPTWVRQARALMIAVRERLHVIDLSTLAMTDLPTPARFASDFALAKDERTIYYAHEDREGDVWMATWPGADARQGKR